MRPYSGTISINCRSIGLSILLSIDRLYYGHWILTPWMFLKVNLIEKVSLFYGSHPLHWYFTQGIPFVLFTSLPLSLRGAYMVDRAYKRQFFSMCVFLTVILSLQGHKEFRFLLPIVAPMQIYAAKTLYSIQQSDCKSGRIGFKAKYVKIAFLIFITNALMAYYFARVHKRGVIDVVLWLRSQSYLKLVSSVLFLMPCHSTPFYSHLHLNIPMRYVSCDPPLGYYFI